MKKVLYVIVAIAVIYLVCCLIGPSNIRVERSSTINASADAVKSQITDYNVFPKWSPWQEKDTAMKISVEGTAGTVGHKYTWEGNKEVGKGTMEITKISADTIVEKLVFDGKGASDVSFIFKADGAGTNVTWAMDMSVPFFGRGMMMFFKGKMDKMLGGDFEKGLAKLKTVAEAAPVASAANYEVKEMDWAAKTYFGKKATVAQDKLTPFFAENFPKIYGAAMKDKLELAGAPSTIFFKWDTVTKTADCAAVLAIAKGDLKGWEKIETPAGKALKLEYFGGYDESMMKAYAALDAYVKEKNLTKNFSIEEYITDPGAEKDTSKWQTNIYYLLK